MTTEEKPKRQLSPEQLEKLKLAREKALAVRQEKAAKMSEIKRLEKEAAQKELNDKLEQVKQKVQPPPPPSPPVATIPKQKRVKKSKAEIIKEVIEEPSSESSSESDDDENVVNPVKHYLKTKYRQKYKNKYESKTMTQLTKGLASHHLKNKVNDEISKMVSHHLFGN